MTALELVLEEIRAAGHDLRHDYDHATGWWLEVDGEVVARGQAIGDLGDAAREWWEGRGPYRTATATPSPHPA